jgi:hypothetical protein
MSGYLSGQRLAISIESVFGRLVDAKVGNADQSGQTRKPE